jgi:hypothetical protein
MRETKYFFLLFVNEISYQSSFDFPRNLPKLENKNMFRHWRDWENERKLLHAYLHRHLIGYSRVCHLNKQPTREVKRLSRI